MNALCLNCGKECRPFKSVGARKYCSYKCGYQFHNNKQKKIGNCLNCGKENQSRLYCSRRCSLVFYYNKTRNLSWHGEETKKLKSYDERYYWGCNGKFPHPLAKIDHNNRQSAAFRKQKRSREPAWATRENNTLRAYKQKQRATHNLLSLSMLPSVIKQLTKKHEPKRTS